MFGDITYGFACKTLTAKLVEICTLKFAPRSILQNQNLPEPNGKSEIRSGKCINGRGSVNGSGKGSRVPGEKNISMKGYYEVTERIHRAWEVPEFFSGDPH